MGRFYHGDINGKFWFAIQDSDDADFFGSTGEAPNTLEYYFDEEEHKESIISGIEFCVLQLGDFKEKIDAYFEEHNGYKPLELAEHLKLLDLGRNDVGKVSKTNSVKVTEKFKVEKYSHVMHIVSNVTGKLRKNFSLFETFLSGFPAGTVSGAPKIRAMEIIDELESSKRKLYAGGVGYFTANQEFDTCIALRTALIKDKKIYVQAGAGIVADSNPKNEYNETINKAKALIKAAIN